MDSSMDAMAPPSDLFDGDILGDELMDIYNAAVVGGSDDDAMNGKSDERERTTNHSPTPLWTDTTAFPNFRNPDFVGSRAQRPQR
jgi:hypothetical protein